MVPGDPGLTGLSVHRAVVEELRPGGDSVTVRPRPRGGKNVRGIIIRRDRATLRPALQVKYSHYYDLYHTDLYVRKTEIMVSFSFFS